MAKEKFVRDKPHLNIGGLIKQKLGLGGPAPVVPPIEPDVEPDSFDSSDSSAEAGSMVLPRVGWEVDVAHGSDSGASEAGDAMLSQSEPDDATDPDELYRVQVKFPTLPDGDQGGGTNEIAADDSSGHEAMFNPTELSIKKSVPWQKADTEGENETITAGGGDTEGALPEKEDEVLVSFEHGDANNPVVIGSLWNGKDTSAPNSGLQEDEASEPSIDHDHVYQHNESDLEFATGRAGVPGTGAASNPDPLPLSNEDTPLQEGKLWQSANFRMELGGLPSQGEGGDPDRPVALGRLYNPVPPAGDSDPDQPIVLDSVPNAADNSSTLVDLTVSEHLVPLDAADAGDADGFDEILHQLPDLDN